MANKGKRPPFRHLIGRELVKQVPAYELDTADMHSVTAARKYVAQNAIKSPAVLHVRCTPHTVHRYYWSNNGMYSALYVEHNYMNFSCLLNYNGAINPHQLIDMDNVQEIELQDYIPEYAFI